MKTVSFQIPEEFSFNEPASDAADLSVIIETCRSAVFALAETLRKTNKDLSAKAVRGIADMLELIHRDLDLAAEEASTLATMFASGPSAAAAEESQSLNIIPMDRRCCGRCGDEKVDSTYKVEFIKGDERSGPFLLCRHCFNAMRDQTRITIVEEE